MSDDLTLEEQIQRDAAAATAAAKKGYGIDLDFSAESLAQVDEILAELHEMVVQGEVSSELVDRICYVWGSYIGEVLRRALGGTWGTESRALRESSPGPLITLYIGNGEIYPINKVYKFMENGPIDAIWAYYQMIRRTLRG